MTSIVLHDTGGAMLSMCGLFMGATGLCDPPFLF